MDEDEADVFETMGLLVGGGVIGLGMRLAVGGEGDGEGGRSRPRDFGGDAGLAAVLTRERGTENERDLGSVVKLITYNTGSF